jgi:hypothetical protein
MREIGSMIKQTVMDNICITMELSTLAIGKMTNNMAREKRLGQVNSFKILIRRWSSL